MADSGFDLKNINKFKKFMNALPDSLQRRVTRQALIASGKPMKERMKDNLSKHNRTGTLQKSIKVKSAKRGRKGKQEVSVLVGAHEARGTSFIRDGFYARFLEFGTAKQPPRPWARPAIDSAMPNQRRILAEEFGKRSVKEVKRQARKFIGLK